MKMLTGSVNILQTEGGETADLSGYEAVLVATTGAGYVPGPLPCYMVVFRPRVVDQDEVRFRLTEMWPPEANTATHIPTGKLLVVKNDDGKWVKLFDVPHGMKVVYAKNPGDDPNVVYCEFRATP